MIAKMVPTMSNKLIYQGLSKEDKKVLKQAIKCGHRIESRFTDGMTPKQRKLLDQVVAERKGKIEEKKKRWLESVGIGLQVRKRNENRSKLCYLLSIRFEHHAKAFSADFRNVIR